MVFWRELLFAASILSATASALVGVIYPYPYPELIAATLLLISTSSPVFLAMTATAMLIFIPIADEYFVYSFYLVIAAVGPLAGLDKIKRFVTRPKFRTLAIGMILVNLVAMFIQFFAPWAWPDIAYVTLGEGQRAAGLKQEPSHTIILLILAATLAITSQPAKQNQAAVLFNAFSLLLFFLTQSELVALVWVAYFLLRVSRQTPRFVFAIALGIVAYLSIGNLYALNEFLFQGMGSWRTVPDFAIMLKPQEFLWPNLSNIQIKLNSIIEAVFATPSFIEWTYSIFSTAIVTIGLIPLSAILLLGYLYWGETFRQVMAIKSVPILLAALIFVPKYESAAIILLAGAPYFVRIDPDGKGVIHSAQLAALRQPYLPKK